VRPTLFPRRSNASVTCLVILQFLLLLSAPNVSAQHERTVAAERRNNYLRSTFNTDSPMTEIHSFYLNLLKADDYPGATGGLETRHTISGTQQNA
jgi:hypothetical protein